MKSEHLEKGHPMGCGPIAGAGQPVQTMEHFTSPGGTVVSYGKSGRGRPLLLVHGSFSDHHSNWEFVEPIFRDRFTVYAIARRGRGHTDATEWHTLDDEAADVVALMQVVGEPVYLLGHSYGAHCALAAAAALPGAVRKLVLYEAGWPDRVSQDILARLEALAAARKFDELAVTFFRDALFVPIQQLEALRETDLWPPIVGDARASLGDVRALARHDFDAERYRQLRVPVLLQIGSESPRRLFVTDALAAVLPDARIEVLAGQAHEGMTTAPAMYAEAVMKFLDS